MKRSKRYALLWLWLLPLSACAESWSLTQLMAQFAGVEERHARYEETQYLSILEVPLVSTGTLHFRSPDKLVREVDDGGVSFRVDGEQLLIRQGGEQRRIALDSHPALAAFVASFRATLAGDLETLRHYYHVTLEGQARDWTLLMRPRQGEMALVVRAVRIEGQFDRVVRIETEEQGGDRTVMTLSESDER